MKVDSRNKKSPNDQIVRSHVALTRALRAPRAATRGPSRQGYMYNVVVPIESRLALTRALRARRARPPEVAEKFSCFAAARAACVSTWLGESLGKSSSLHNHFIYAVQLDGRCASRISSNFSNFFEFLRCVSIERTGQ